MCWSLLPCSVKIVHTRIVLFGVFAAGALRNFVERVIAAKGRAIEAGVGEKYGCSTGHGKERGAFVDVCSECKLFGGHKTRRGRRVFRRGATGGSARGPTVDSRGRGAPKVAKISPMDSKKGPGGPSMRSVSSKGWLMASGHPASRVRAGARRRRWYRRFAGG